MVDKQEVIDLTPYPDKLTFICVIPPAGDIDQKIDTLKGRVTALEDDKEA